MSASPTAFESRSAAPNPAQATAPSTSAQGLQIHVSAKGKPFWLTTVQDDDKKKKGRMLSPDKPEDFSPQDSLDIMFDKPSAEFLEVSINGRPARLPDDAASTGQRVDTDAAETARSAHRCPWEKTVAYDGQEPTPSAEVFALR